MFIILNQQRNDTDFDYLSSKHNKVISISGIYWNNCCFRGKCRSIKTFLLGQSHHLLKTELCFAESWAAPPEPSLLYFCCLCPCRLNHWAERSEKFTTDKACVFLPKKKCLSISKSLIFFLLYWNQSAVKKTVLIFMCF